MRTWRVGSFSMGAALVFLGIFLLLAQFFKWDPAIAMVSWWPFLFIILGVEILIYLAVKKEEKPIVKYDFISIIFIGIISTFGLGMAMLNATGLLEVTSQFVSAEERTSDLPKFEERLTDDIKRVSVETGSYSVTIEGSPGKEAVIFGTYRGFIGKGIIPLKNVADYALIEKQGDTLYIRFKEMPTSRLMNHGGQVHATLLIPSNVMLDVVGNGGDMEIKPRDLKADWSIDNVGYLNMDMNEDANITIEAVDLHKLDEDREWGSKEEEVVEKESGMLSGNFIFGTGAHTLKVKNTYALQLK